MENLLLILMLGVLVEGIIYAVRKAKQTSTKK